MRRTLVALWFADIAGYSEHAAEDESSALRLVEILQTSSRETVTRYNGRVVKFLGDAIGKILLVTFGAEIGKRQHGERAQTLLPFSGALRCGGKFRGIFLQIQDVQFDRSNSL